MKPTQLRKNLDVTTSIVLVTLRNVVLQLSSSTLFLWVLLFLEIPHQLILFKHLHPLPRVFSLI